MFVVQRSGARVLEITEVSFTYQHLFRSSFVPVNSHRNLKSCQLLTFVQLFETASNVSMKHLKIILHPSQQKYKRVQKRAKSKKTAPYLHEAKHHRTQKHRVWNIPSIFCFITVATRRIPLVITCITNPAVLTTPHRT